MRYFVPVGAIFGAGCNLVVVFPFDSGQPTDRDVPDTDSDTDADSDADTDIDTDVWTHDPVPETQLCWDCHESDRLSTAHWSSSDVLERWDCGPCHTTVSWADSTRNHPVKTPHGTTEGQSPTAPTAWVVACSACHTDPADPAAAVCSDCHLGIFPHYGALDPGSAADATCLACHVDGSF